MKQKYWSHLAHRCSGSLSRPTHHRCPVVPGPTLGSKRCVFIIQAVRVFGALPCYHQSNLAYRARREGGGCMKQKYWSHLAHRCSRSLSRPTRHRCPVVPGPTLGSKRCVFIIQAVRVSALSPAATSQTSRTEPAGRGGGCMKQKYWSHLAHTCSRSLSLPTRHRCPRER